MVVKFLNKTMCKYNGKLSPVGFLIYILNEYWQLDFSDIIQKRTPTSPGLSNRGFKAPSCNVFGACSSIMR